MKKFQFPLSALLCILLLSACHSLPKHARYIPEDAAVVVGVNTGEISKKVAWSAITGSKILDEMKESAKNAKGKEALNDIEHSGIDFMSTLYFYAKPDKRFDNDVRMSIVVPLEDAGKWTAFVKKVFPTATINKIKDRNEALLDGKAYAAWTNDVLMVMNTKSSVSSEDASMEATAVDTMAAVPAPVGGDDTTMPMDMPAPATTTVAVITKVDTALSASEMDAAFGQDEKHSITGNKRFKKLESDGHDISVYVSYGNIMDSYAANAGMGMMSMMTGVTLWKNAVMATGIDFEKGKISSIIQYYPSDSMKDVAKLFGADNIDKDILSRTPSQNLNLIAGYHLSPKATKMMLDRMNLSGMANMVLMQKGLSVDEILNAFTGDMVLALNNVRAKAVNPQDSMMEVSSGTPDIDFVYAMEINSKASFNKLLALAGQEGGLQQTSPGTYSIPGTKDMSLVVGDKYFAVSNVAANAQAFLAKSGGKVPEVAGNNLTGHPVGMYFDIKQTMTPMMGMLTGGTTNATMMLQMSNMLSNITFYGGEFKGESNEYHMTLNLVNKDENSLLQLLRMAQLMGQAKKEGVAGS